MIAHSINSKERGQRSYVRYHQDGLADPLTFGDSARRPEHVAALGCLARGTVGRCVAAYMVVCQEVDHSAAYSRCPSLQRAVCRHVEGRRTRVRDAGSARGGGPARAVGPDYPEYAGVVPGRAAAIAHGCPWTVWSPCTRRSRLAV